MEKTTFDLSLMYVKALSLGDRVVKGPLYLYRGYPTVHDTRTCADLSVSPWSICRNTGIKDKNNKYVYDHDLLKCHSFSSGDFYAYIEWSDYEKSWVLRRGFEYSGCRNAKDTSIELAGNVLLNESDADIIRRQDEDEGKRNVVIDNSYCPSMFKK